LSYIPAQKLRFEFGFEGGKLWMFDHPSLYLSASIALEQGNSARFETDSVGFIIYNVRTKA